MVKIKDLYAHCKTNSKPLLMNENILSLYPVIEGDTSNFIQYYLDHKHYIDKAFLLRYKDKCAMFIDTTSFPSAYNEWIDETNSFVVYYIESWARLWYALNLDYNPTWNYDGKNETKTVGQLGSNIGTDQTTNHVDPFEVTDTFSGSNTTTKDYTVPTDSTTERETDKTSVEESDSGTTHYENVKESTSTTQFGTTNEADYTVTEIKGGNQGTTSTQQLLREEYELRKKAFFDMVFDTLVKELTVWEV